MASGSSQDLRHVAVTKVIGWPDSAVRHTGQTLGGRVPPLPAAAATRPSPAPRPPGPPPSAPALLPGSGAVPHSASFLRKSWKNTSGIGVAFSGLLQRGGMKGPPAGTPPARLPPRGPRVHVSRLRLLRTQETCASTWDGHTDRTVRSHLRLCCRRPPRGRDHVLGAGAAPPRPTRASRTASPAERCRAESRLHK